MLALQERRKDFVKQASKMAEDGKVAIRSAIMLFVKYSSIQEWIMWAI